MHFFNLQQLKFVKIFYSRSNLSNTYFKLMLSIVITFAFFHVSQQYCHSSHYLKVLQGILNLSRCIIVFMALNFTYNLLQTKFSIHIDVEIQDIATLSMLVFSKLILCIPFSKQAYEASPVKRAFRFFLDYFLVTEIFFRLFLSNLFFGFIFQIFQIIMQRKLHRNSFLTIHVKP